MTAGIIQWTNNIKKEVVGLKRWQNVKAGWLSDWLSQLLIHHYQWYSTCNQYIKTDCKDHWQTARREWSLTLWHLLHQLSVTYPIDKYIWSGTGLILPEISLTKVELLSLMHSLSFIAKTKINFICELKKLKDSYSATYLIICCYGSEILILVFWKIKNEYLALYKLYTLKSQKKHNSFKLMPM